MTERGSRTARPFLPVLSGCLSGVGRNGLRIISLTGESAFRPGFGGVVSFVAGLLVSCRVRARGPAPAGLALSAREPLSRRNGPRRGHSNP